MDPTTAARKMFEPVPETDNEPLSGLTVIPFLCLLTAGILLIGPLSASSAHDLTFRVGGTASALTGIVSAIVAVVSAVRHHRRWNLLSSILCGAGSAGFLAFAVSALSV